MSKHISTPANTPRKISQNGASEGLIEWLDGHESYLNVRMLRLACPCASCVDEWSGERILQSDKIPNDIHPVRIESVGRYAIQISWSDGHETGIYPFRQLRKLDQVGDKL